MQFEMVVQVMAMQSTCTVINNNGFGLYVDDLTKQLSRIYDISRYRGPAMTLGESDTESYMGRLLYISKLAGQIVGVNMKTYLTEFPKAGWQHYPNVGTWTVEQWEEMERKASDGDIYFRRMPDEVFQRGEFILEAAGRYVSKIIGAEAMRIAEVRGTKYYIPTEALVQEMLYGIEPIRPDMLMVTGGLLYPCKHVLDIE